MTNLAKMGAKLRAAQDSVSDPERDLRVARLRFLEAPVGRSPAARVPSRWALGAASLAAAAVVGFFLMRSEPLTLEAGSASLTPGDWVSAHGSPGKPLTFSDGSTVLLQAGARARVARLDERGARVEISRGRAVVSVVHRKDTHYQFELGPFLVEVTGTRFEMGWEPQSQTFSLEMLEGSVRVSGGGLPAARTFITGQRVELSPSIANAAEALPPSEPPTWAPSPEEEAEEAEEAVVTLPRREPPSAHAERRERPGRARRRKPASQDAPPRWRELARGGEHASAVQAAERSGLANLLARASGADLLLLADSAIYSGHAGLARRAFQTVRERYAKTTAAAQAAFGLGRLSPGRAGVRWFGTYLEESPSGPLAREALGRILEVEAASGDIPRAKAVARRYLTRFPGGPHEALAVKALGAPD